MNKTQEITYEFAALVTSKSDRTKVKRVEYIPNLSAVHYASIDQKIANINENAENSEFYTRITDPAAIRAIATLKKEDDEMIRENRETLREIANQLSDLSSDLNSMTL